MHSRRSHFEIDETLSMFLKPMQAQSRARLRMRLAGPSRRPQLWSFAAPIVFSQIAVRRKANGRRPSSRLSVSFLCAFTGSIGDSTTNRCVCSGPISSPSYAREGIMNGVIGLTKRGTLLCCPVTWCLGSLFLVL